MRLILFLLCLSFAKSSFPQYKNNKENKKYNVLFIVSDDQSYTALQLINPSISTPHLNRLASQSVYLSRASLQVGQNPAVCVSSRATIITGMGVHSMPSSPIPDNKKLLGEQFKEAGYTTFGTGKWHNGVQTFTRSFDYGANVFFGGMYPNQWTPVLQHYKNENGTPKFEEWKGNRFSSEYFAEAAVNFLDTVTTSTKPFFCYLSFTSPHDPRNKPPAQFRNLYNASSLPLMQNFMPSHPYDIGVEQIRDEQLQPKPLQPITQKEDLANYYAMVSEMDSRVGQVLDVLEKRGLRESTFIVFVSDNGLSVGAHGLLGKQNLYEESVRVPCFIAGPGLPNNTTCNALIQLQDLYPTILSLCEVTQSAKIDGLDFSPVIKGSREILRPFVFHTYVDIQRAVKTHDNWKLIGFNFHDKFTWLLYDLNKDPYELQNLADNPVYQKRFKKMLALLNKAANANNDKFQFEINRWIQSK